MRKSTIALFLLVLAAVAGTGYGQTVPRTVVDSTWFRAQFHEATQFGNPTYIAAYGQTNSLNGFGIFGTANVSGGFGGGFFSVTPGTLNVDAHRNVGLWAVGANGVSGINVGLEVASNSFTSSGLTGRAIQVDSGDVYLGRSIVNGGPANTTYVNTLTLDGPLVAGGSAGTTNQLLVSTGSSTAPAWTDAPTALNLTSWLLNGNTLTSTQTLGTITNYDLPVITNNVERMRIRASNGYVGINTTTPSQPLEVKGTVLLSASGGVASKLGLQNPAGTKTTTFAAGAQAANIDYTLPLAIPSTGNSGVLLTDDAGTLTWSPFPVTQNVIAGNGTATEVAFFQGTVGAASQSVTSSPNLFWDNVAVRLGVGTNTPTQAITVKDGSVLLSNTGSAGQLQLQGTGAGITTFQAGAQGATNINYTLPTAAPTTNGYVLSSTTAGVMSWADPVANAWLLNGNTVATVKSLGTTTNFDLPIITNNTERLRVTSGGNIGIGTTTPAQLLELKNGNLLLSNSGSAGQLQMQTPGGSFATTFTTVAQTADINYSLPAAAPASNNYVLTGSTAGIMSWQDPATLTNAWALTGNTGTTPGTNFVGTTDGKAFIVKTNSVQRAWFANADSLRLGIMGSAAVAPPTAFVVGSAGWTLASTANNQAGTDLIVQSGAGTGNSTTNGNVIFQTPAAGASGTAVETMTERMRITQTGRVGIGTNAPSQALEVKGNALLSASAGVASKLGLQNPAATFTTTFAAGAQAANIDYTLPLSTPSAGNQGVLLSDASGTLSWVTFPVTQNVIAGNGTATEVAFFSGTVGAASTTVTSNSNLFWDNVSKYLGVGTNAPTQAITVKDGSVLLSNSGTAGQLQFQGTGAGITTFKAGGQGATNINYTLPTAAPATSGYMLASTTAGVMSWADPVANAWQLNGNAVVAIKTLGTTSNFDLPIITNNTERMRVTASGNVGFGTSTPSQMVEVKDGNVFLSNTGTPAQLQFKGTSTGITSFQAGAQGATNITYTLPTAAPAVNNYVLAGTTGGVLSWADPASLTNAWSLVGNASTTPGTNFVGTTDAKAFMVKTNGVQRAWFANADSLRLGIMGSAAVTPPAAFVVGSAGWTLASTASDQAGTDLVIQSGAGTGNSTANGNVIFQTPVAGATGTTVESMSEKMRLTQTGRLGIGTNAPAQLVEMKNGNLLLSNTSTAGQLQLQNPGGTFTSTFAAGAQTANIDYTLPITMPAALTTGVLTTTPTGTLSWSTIPNGANLVVGGGSATQVAYWTGANSLGGQNNLWWDPTNTRLGVGTNAPSQMVEVKNGNVLLSSTGTAGQLQLQNPAGTFVSTFAAGAQLANINYTLPTAAPASNGYVLASTTAGVMSWSDPVANAWILNGNTVASIKTLGTTSNFDLPIITNNTEKMRVTAAGNVGIGTSAPGQMLEVKDGNVLLSNSGTAKQLQFQGTSTGITTFQAGAQGATNINYTLPTVTPGNGFVLSSTAAGVLSWSNPTTVSNSWLLTGNASTTPGTNFVGTTDGTAFMVKTNSVQRAWFANADSLRLGIMGSAAVTPPGAFVIGSAGWTLASTANNQAGTDLIVQSGAGTGNSVASGNVIFQTPAAGASGTTVETMTERMRITPAGNVGIGTTAPSQPLEVKGNALISSTGGVANKLQLQNPAATFTSTFAAGAQAANIDYVLPITMPAVSTTGVLTTTPTGTLSWSTIPNGANLVVGGGSATQVAYWTGANSLSGQNNLWWDPTNTRLGVGTSTPTQMVEVKDDNLLLSNYGAATQLQFKGTSTGITTFQAGAQGATNINYTLPTAAPVANGYVLSSTTGGALSWSNPATVSSAWLLTGNASTTAGTNFVGTTDGTAFVVKTSSVQREWFANADSIRWGIMGSAAVAPPTAFVVGAAGWTLPSTANNQAGTNLIIQSGAGTGNSTTNGNVIFQTPAAGASGATVESMSERMRITQTGNVGIGTNAPGQLLEVKGNALISATGGVAGQLQMQNPAATFKSTIAAGAQLADINYTLPTAAPVANNYVLASTTAGAMSWVDANTLITAGSFVQYNVSAQQATSTPRTNALFNVAYSGVAAAANAAGATIASSSNGGAFGATGLTVTSAAGSGLSQGVSVTSTGTGTTTGLTVSATGGTTNYAALFTNGSVGVGTATPAALLDVTASLSGTPGLTGKYISQSASTFTDNATAVSGTAANMTFNSISQPTLAATNAAVTTTNAYSMYIAGAPIKGANETVTNSVALNIAGGNVVAATNGYGLRVNATTGATNNYAATFSGGNVGVATTTPTQPLEVKGNTLLSANGGVASQLQMQNPAGTFATTIAAGAQAGNIAYTLPTAQGTANTVLTNDGAGALSWGNPTATVIEGVSTTALGAANINNLSIVATGITIYRVTSTAGIDVTGIDATGITTGRTIRFVNVGSNTIRFMYESASSTATNRILTNSAGSAEQLGPNDAITFWYDVASARWRMMSKNY